MPKKRPKSHGEFVTDEKGRIFHQGTIQGKPFKDYIQGHGQKEIGSPERAASHRETNMSEIKGRNKQGQFTKGNPQSCTAALKTGAHSKMFKVTGKVPSVRGARQLQRDMAQLTATLEEITPEINAKKVLLIKQVVRTETLLRLIEGYMKEHGILQPFKARKYIMELQPAMSGTYLSLLTAQRNSIMALGLDPKQVDAVKAPYEIVEAEK